MKKTAIERRRDALSNPKPTIRFVKALGLNAATAPAWGGFKHSLVEAGVIASVDADCPLEYLNAYRAACGREPVASLASVPSTKTTGGRDERVFRVGINRKHETAGFDSDEVEGFESAKKALAMRADALGWSALVALIDAAKDGDRCIWQVNRKGERVSDATAFEVWYIEPSC